MAEERRRTRRKLAILRGILHTVLGFVCILVFAIFPSPDRTDLTYILSVLFVCAIGVLSCYWALGDFLSAYKEKDALINVYLMSDFHIGHFQGRSSLIDSHIVRSYVRDITDPKKQTMSKIPPYDA